MYGCDTTLDLMFEQAVERQWEADNAEIAKPLDTVERINVLYAGVKLEAMRKINLSAVIEAIAEAAALIENTPEADRLMSLVDELTDIDSEVREMRKALDQNWRAR